jgi:hypothetical protein
MFWIVGFIALASLAPMSNQVDFRPMYFGGFLQALLPFLPAIAGGVASLFKGKKTKFASQQTPQQQAAYNQLLRMLQQRMGQPSAGTGATNDAMNLLYSKFLGRGYTPPQQQMGPQQPFGMGGLPLTPNNLRPRTPRT